MSGGSGAAALREFDRILEQRQLRTVFQPIVHLASGATVGYEALVRGPAGSSLRSATSLLAAAFRADRVAEFDWAARAAACRAALAAGLSRDQLLFINVEPVALDSDCPRDLWPDIERAFTTLRIVLEVTERSLDRDPGTLLDGLDRQRPAVAGLALDDVGADPATLAMMPLIAPSVIKLDLAITQAAPTPEITKVLDIVYEEAERTGATILAEGIETPAHLATARSIGASLGQGNHLAAPAALARHAKQITRRMELTARTPPSVATPFDALRGQLTARASPTLLVPMSRRIASSGAGLPVPALLIAHVPDPHLFDTQERRRYARLARRGVTTALLGPGIPAEPGRGIRGVGLRQEPPLTREWAVVTLSPSSSAAMLARATPEDGMVFDFGITHDTQRVIAAARSLFRRLGAPVPRWLPDEIGGYQQRGVDP